MKGTPLQEIPRNGIVIPKDNLNRDLREFENYRVFAYIGRICFSPFPSPENPDASHTWSLLNTEPFVR